MLWIVPHFFVSNFNTVAVGENTSYIFCNKYNARKNYIYINGISIFMRSLTSLM